MYSKIEQRALLIRFDTSGDGDIDYAEFCDFVNGGDADVISENLIRLSNISTDKKVFNENVAYLEGWDDMLSPVPKKWCQILLTLGLNVNPNVASRLGLMFNGNQELFMSFMNNPRIAESLIDNVNKVDRELYIALRKLIPDVSNEYMRKEVWNKIVNTCVVLLNRSGNDIEDEGNGNGNGGEEKKDGDENKDEIDGDNNNGNSSNILQNSRNDDVDNNSTVNPFFPINLFIKAIIIVGKMYDDPDCPTISRALKSIK